MLSTVAPSNSVLPVSPLHPRSAHTPIRSRISPCATAWSAVGCSVFDAGQRKQPSQRFRQPRKVQLERAPAGAGVESCRDQTEAPPRRCPSAQVARGKSHARAAGRSHRSRLAVRQSNAGQFVDQPVAAQRQDRLLLLAGDLPRRTHGLHVLSTVLRRHEHTDPLPVSVGDRLRRLFVRHAPIAQRDERIPERGSACGENRQTPAPPAALAATATILSALEPRPETMHPTRARPSRLAVSRPPSHSRRPSPGLRPSRCPAPRRHPATPLIAAIISDGRRS